VPLPLVTQGIRAIRCTASYRPLLPDLADDLADAAMQARTPNTWLVANGTGSTATESGRAVSAEMDGDAALLVVEDRDEF